jgi:hypothetical protein
MNKSREKQVSPIPYGLQPGQARQDHPVLAPEARNRAGRRKGSVNKYTSTLRELILRAAEEVGDSQEVGKDGNGGALAYLKVSAIKERKTFKLMMARIRSTKIHSEGQVKENLSLTEAVAELKACGLDERLAFYLMRPVERDEEESAFADLIDVTILDQLATDKPAIDASPNASTPPASKDGNGGALAYLKVSAIKERKTFLLMMARILPTKIHSEVRQVKELSLMEAVAELKACGFEKALAFYLKCYPVGRDEKDTAWADLIDVTILDQPATDKPADVSPNASPPPATDVTE